MVIKKRLGAVFFEFWQKMSEKINGQEYTLML